MMIGTTKSARSDPAWRQVFRAISHGQAKQACMNQAVMKKFPKDLEDFGNVFVEAQVKRHAADYDPFVSYVRSEVITDINAAELAIKNLSTVSKKDRRAFAAWVMLKDRK